MASKNIIAITSTLWLVGNDERALSFIRADMGCTEIEGDFALIDRVINAHRHSDAIFFD